MDYKELVNNYKRYYSFESLIQKAKLQTNEAYFGLNNPLRVGLIYNLGIIKKLIIDARQQNPNINGLELIDICKNSFDNVSKLIEESFNIERCTIGFQKAINAACYAQIYNKKIIGISEEATKMRIKLDDIVECKDGFRYKDGKGIYYVLCIGLQLFYNDEFTIEDIGGIIVHELGHCMQQIVHDINASSAITYWCNVMRSIDSGILTMGDLNKKTRSLIDMIRKSHHNKDYEKMIKLGKEINDNSDPEDFVDFEKLDSHEITAIFNDDTPIDGTDLETIPKKRNIFIRTFIGILKIPLSIIFALFLIPMIISLKVSLSGRNGGLWKHSEMIADAFEVFYGFGAEAGESNAKINKYRSIAGDMGLINYVPLLNLWKYCKDIRREHIAMIFGYPSDRQRIINAYINCEFELKNNKDLSPEAKNELQNQINLLKDTYDHFVKKQDTKGGFLYKIASIIGHNTLENAAKKDTTLVEEILKPLMKKRDAGAFKS
jgi:hypothetical protein